MQNGEIFDDKISLEQGAVIGASNDPRKGRLNNPPGNIWTPPSTDVAKMVVNLVSQRRILGIDAHGNKDPSNPRYPTVFQVEYWKVPSNTWTIARSVSTYKVPFLM